MADLELASVLSEIARVIGEETTRPCFVCSVPAEVVAVPYLVIWPMPGRWEQGPLEQGADTAWVGIQVDGVGKAVVDALWALDKARRVLLHHRPIAGDGWALGGAVSDGPPEQGDSDPPVRSFSERFMLFVTSG